MIGTVRCTYETPCGWCTKWDKECDEKPYTKSHRINNPKPIKVVEHTEEISNKICKTEEDHVWEWCGASTQGLHYICRICGAKKIV